MYPHNRYCPTNPFDPIEQGICDRCGFRRYLRDLPFQYDQRGMAVVNLGLRVCVDRCYDEVATMLQPVVIIGPEGVVRDPRPDHYAQQSMGGVPAPTVGDPIFPDGWPFPA